MDGFRDFFFKWKGSTTIIRWKVLLNVIFNLYNAILCEITSDFCFRSRQYFLSTWKLFYNFILTTHNFVSYLLGNTSVAIISKLEIKHKWFSNEDDQTFKIFFLPRFNYYFLTLWSDDWNNFFFLSVEYIFKTNDRHKIWKL